MRDLPVACTLSAAELEARREGLLPSLLRQATDRLALANGYRFTFTPTAGLLETIASVIDAERQCCRFQLVVEQDGGLITFDVTGPEGTKGFLADLIGRGGTRVPPYERSSRSGRPPGNPRNFV